MACWPTSINFSDKQLNKPSLIKLLGYLPQSEMSVSYTRILILVASVPNSYLITCFSSKSLPNYLQCPTWPTSLQFVHQREIDAQPANSANVQDVQDLCFTGGSRHSEIMLHPYCFPLFNHFQEIIRTDYPLSRLLLYALQYFVPEHLLENQQLSDNYLITLYFRQVLVILHSFGYIT